VTAVAIAFWLSAGSIVYTHLGYLLALRLLLALRRRPKSPRDLEELPRVSLIVAAYDEEEVIAEKVANALALDYPRELLELIVASDGSGDATAERARAAGADLVLELSRGGKTAAQNAAAERASGEILAFSDANSVWSPDALRCLVAPFADAAVGYACGQVRFLDAAGDNLEGAYWRYEMAVREMESSLASPPATVRSTPFAPPTTSRWNRRAATISPSPSSWPSAASARSTSQRPLPRRRWCRRSRASSPASGG
jgi:hypothetical protein